MKDMHQEVTELSKAIAANWTALGPHTIVPILDRLDDIESRLHRLENPEYYED